VNQAQDIAAENGSTVIRRAAPADVEICGRICFEAFETLAQKHGFAPDFPSPVVVTQILSSLFSHPSFFCVVAEQNGQIIGSNCLDERNTIAGVGPITIDPAAQNQSVGRQLMQAVMSRSEAKGFAGIRLVQAAYHNRSLALYAKLGFQIREPLACMQGKPLRTATPGYDVRPATESDIPACNQLCRRVHGHNREGELLDGLKQGTAVVALRDGMIRAYASSIAFFGHAVADANVDLQSLIAAAEEFKGPGILVPTRNTELFRWCLQKGLQVTQPLTLMTAGLYSEPAGAYLPSILY
jgi:predicted N-acetyltransferase YhbS